MRRFVRLLCAASVALALAGTAAHATIVVDRTVPELAAHADLVVRGKVTAQKVQWDEQHQLIVTRTYIERTESLKGDAPANFVVRQVGGQLDGLMLNVQGLARFEIGEEVVLFLEKHPKAPGEFVLESMAASKFSLVPTKGGLMAERTLAGLTLAQRGEDGLIRPEAATPTPNALPYDVLVKLVRGATPSAPALRLITPNLIRR